MCSLSNSASESITDDASLTYFVPRSDGCRHISASENQAHVCWSGACWADGSRLFLGKWPRAANIVITIPLLMLITTEPHKMEGFTAWISLSPIVFRFLQEKAVFDVCRLLHDQLIHVDKCWVRSISTWGGRARSSCSAEVSSSVQRSC